MTEHIIRLASGLPKEETNGFDDAVLAKDLWEAKIGHRDLQPRVAILIYGVREAKVAKDGSNIATVETMRVQPVTSDESRRQIESILLTEFREQTGAQLYPYEVESVTKAAFVDLPKSAEEIDREEAEQQDHMSPTDELRKHLERVHGVDGVDVLTPEELDAKHAADHEGSLLTENGMDHDPEWLGWTRVDLEVAAAEAENDDSEPYLAGEHADYVGGQTGSGKTDPYDSMKGGVSDAKEFAADPPHEAGLFRSENS